jgi:hypothetical protein
LISSSLSTKLVQLYKPEIHQEIFVSSEKFSIFVFKISSTLMLLGKLISSLPMLEITLLKNSSYFFFENFLESSINSQYIFDNQEELL